MSNYLTQSREAVADLINGADIRAVSEAPESFIPPLCYPRSVTRVPGQTFSRKRLRIEVVCVAAVGVNAIALAAAEELASTVADVVEASDSFRLDPSEEIGEAAPYQFDKGQVYLGIPVNVLVEVDR